MKTLQICPYYNKLELIFGENFDEASQCNECSIWEECRIEWTKRENAKNE